MPLFSLKKGEILPRTSVIFSTSYIVIPVESWVESLVGWGQINDRIKPANHYKTGFFCKVYAGNRSHDRKKCKKLGKNRRERGGVWVPRRDHMVILPPSFPSFHPGGSSRLHHNNLLSFYLPLLKKNPFYSDEFLLLSIFLGCLFSSLFFFLKNRRKVSQIFFPFFCTIFYVTAFMAPF